MPQSGRGVECDGQQGEEGEEEEEDEDPTLSERLHNKTIEVSCLATQVSVCVCVCVCVCVRECT